ncbi:MAG TPA: DUF4382 domain-containing protein [Niastella sp.]|nr:DUF4382 domain-containing protein [Niastella sp.]
MKLSKTILSFSLLTFFVATLTSCAKHEAGSSRMQVYMTDDPGDYEAVYIDVKDIMINSSSDSSKGWTSLANVQHGTYNLLDLVNDKDTMLADASIPSGRVQQIRLVLGNENYVKINGQMIKLQTPSAQQSGLKLNIHQDVVEGVTYKLLLDFDVAKSVHESGNGSYILKPTIRTLLQAIGGNINGFVAPDSVQTAVLAIQDLDTVASTYSLNGGYVIKGLPAGQYDLHFIPTNAAFEKQIKNSVTVTTGVVSTVDTVFLK